MQSHSLNTNQIIPGARTNATSRPTTDIARSFKNVLFDQYHRPESSGVKNSRIVSNHGKAESNAKLLAPKLLAPNLLDLGKISSENPTVSDLLVKHPIHGEKCWSIIHSKTNTRKPFNRIQAGATIFMNPKTLEISWRNESKNAQRITTDPHRFFATRGLMDNIQSSTRIHDSTEMKTNLKPLGKISDAHSTISSLLVKHPEYSEKCWRIIHSDINQDKPFDKLNAGTSVYINPKTLELSWKKDDFSNELSTASIRHHPFFSLNDYAPVGNMTLSDKLESAVRSFVGKPYAELDCYELVVRGLKQLGIRYSGKNGLKEMLVNKALGEGLPINSYLTGDGLIHTAGKNLFSKTVSNSVKSNISAQSLLKEMEPYLDKGLILSFSTPTRGHMGIISNQNQVWTFINSGTMDHRFDQQKTSKGVGEERLLPEIRNWLRLANKRKEPLQITLGRISESRLVAKNLTPTKKIALAHNIQTQS